MSNKKNTIGAYLNVCKAFAVDGVLHITIEVEYLPVSKGRPDMLLIETDGEFTDKMKELIGEAVTTCAHLYELGNADQVRMVKDVREILGRHSSFKNEDDAESWASSELAADLHRAIEEMDILALSDSIREEGKRSAEEFEEKFPNNSSDAEYWFCELMAIQIEDILRSAMKLSSSESYKKGYSDGVATKPITNTIVVNGQIDEQELAKRIKREFDWQNGNTD